MNWQGPFSGRDIDRPFLEGRLGKGVPGVYLWRRVQRQDPDCLVSSEDFLRWINRGVQAPLLITDGLRLSSDKRKGALSVRANFLETSHFSIGGGTLTETKVAQLEDLDDNMRMFFYNRLIEATYTFGPVMYVGESDCLLTRFSQHVTGSSALNERLYTLGLSLTDVALFFCTDSTLAEKATRTLFESMLTHMLGTPLTFRAG